jgi:hypothetical protein
MASEPVLALGKPTLGPGWLEITAPAFPPLPAVLDGARSAPVSSAAPRPEPLRARPEPAIPEPPPTVGGGGTTLLASSRPEATPAPPPVLSVPPPAPESEGGGGTTLGAPKIAAEDDARGRLPVPPVTPVEGGGATTFEASAGPMPLRVARGTPPMLTVGGGATTLGASDVLGAPAGPFA